MTFIVKIVFVPLKMHLIAKKAFYAKVNTEDNTVTILSKQEHTTDELIDIVTKKPDIHQKQYKIKDAFTTNKITHLFFVLLNKVFYESHDPLLDIFLQSQHSLNPQNNINHDTDILS